MVVGGYCVCQVTLGWSGSENGARAVVFCSRAFESTAWSSVPTGRIRAPGLGVWTGRQRNHRGLIGHVTLPATKNDAACENGRHSAWLLATGLFSVPTCQISFVFLYHRNCLNNKRGRNAAGRRQRGSARFACGKLWPEEHLVMLVLFQSIGRVLVEEVTARPVRREI